MPLSLPFVITPTRNGPLPASNTVKVGSVCVLKDVTDSQQIPVHSAPLEVTTRHQPCCCPETGPGSIANGSGHIAMHDLNRVGHPWAHANSHIHQPEGRPAFYRSATDPDPFLLHPHSAQYHQQPQSANYNPQSFVKPGAERRSHYQAAGDSQQCS